MSFYEIIFRTVIIFITVYIWARILGKKLISQMTFFDYVAGIALGSLTASSIMTPGIDLYKTVVSISLFSLLALLLGLTSLNSLSLRKIINSQPSTVIENGEIQYYQLKKIRLDISDLLMQLRKKNAFYLNEIETAIVETDGTLSVLKKANAMNVTKADLQVITPSRGIPYNLVVDGKVIRYNLKALDKDDNWLQTSLLSNGVTDISKVMLCQIDKQNHISIHQKPAK